MLLKFDNITMHIIYDILQLKASYHRVYITYVHLICVYLGSELHLPPPLIRNKSAAATKRKKKLNSKNRKITNKENPK